MRINDVVQQFGRQIGLDLKLDAGGACRLTFDGRTIVDVEAADDSETAAFLHSTVGLVPAVGKEGLYQLLLEGNHFGRDTGRSVLSVDTDLGEIVLVRHLDMDKLTMADFTAALENFLAVSRAWTEKLRNRVPEDGPAPSFSADETFIRI